MTEDRLLVLSGLALWLGVSLLLLHVPTFSRVRLVDRLRPFTAGASAPTRVEGAGVRGVLVPVALEVGARLGRALGMADDVEARLFRIHSSRSVAAFRLRQLGWALAAVALAVTTCSAAGVPASAVLLAGPAAAVGAYAVTEMQLNGECRRFEERRTLEMPVVAEQLAMLVSAGYSLGSALGRVASRGTGACALDIARVHRRIQHGVTERTALLEWANQARSPGVDRLVAVLALNGETGDVGRLLSEEARSIRRSVQRRTVEIMDRRSQQVWVPVTVAALVPGVIFLAVPFVAALRLFAGG
ncbi:MAG TPA: type II secretion system F family protein [Acidimicrobiales bacterium]|nr:type II secretion system F family protein [Acidimicrobiales bacterium]